MKSGDILRSPRLTKCQAVNLVHQTEKMAIKLMMMMMLVCLLVQLGKVAFN